MYSLWRLKLMRWRVQFGFNREYRSLQKRKASRQEFDEHDANEHFAIRILDESINRRSALQLWREGNALDLELPPYSDQEMWTCTDDGEYTYLSAKGRARVRKLVDAEKARRFEVKTLWVTKIILPVAGILVGILGALAALFAVLHHR